GAEPPLAVQVDPIRAAESRTRVLGSWSSPADQVCTSPPGGPWPPTSPHGGEGNRPLAADLATWCGDSLGERSLSAHNNRSVTLRRATRHISVKDVAAHAGVSFQTTSKVLNGGGTVSELTRARILQVASDLGYVPNLQARSLVMQRTRTVGFVASDFSDHNLSRFIVGAEHEARRQAYGV